MERSVGLAEKQFAWSKRKNFGGDLLSQGMSFSLNGRSK